MRFPWQRLLALAAAAAVAVWLLQRSSSAVPEPLAAAAGSPCEPGSGGTPQPPRWERFEGVDVAGSDLLVVPNAEGQIARLQRMCEQLDQCVAFNSNGWLKQAAGARVPAQLDLYVKRQGQGQQQQGQILPRPGTLRIFVYPELARGVAAPRDYKYGAEELFPRLLAASAYVVADPALANVFLVPVRCTAHRYTTADRASGQAAAELAARDLVRHVRAAYPYFNRSLGTDHVYLCAHDMGASCLRQADPLFRKNAVGLLNTADREDPDYVSHRDIALPPNIGDGCPSCTQGAPGMPAPPTLPSRYRRHLAFFAGQFDRGRVRPRIKQLFWQTDGFVLVDGALAPEDYHMLLQTSVFCLFLRGHRAWSPRLMDGLWHGCVPVIVSDGYELPLATLVDWPSMAVLVPEDRIPDLPSILRAIPMSRAAQLQANGWRARQLLTWPAASPMDQTPNAFTAILHLLAGRMNGHAFSSPHYITDAF